MEFEWDEVKAASNLRKHGVAFEDAVDVFNDVFALEKQDPDGLYDEDRWVTVGLVDGYAHTVISTARGTKTRLISARKANADERREYWQNRSIYL